MAVNQVATLGVKVDPRGAVTGASRAKKAITGIGKTASNVKNRIMSMQGALLGLGAGAVLKSIITTASSVESLRVRLKFLTGSTEDAAKAFDIMNEFASKVPFSLEDIERASPLLLTVAKSTDELNELLAITGDIAAISGLSFEATAGQLQRAMAGGIASADLFRERGVKAFLGFEEGVQFSAEETTKHIKKIFRDGTTTAKGATEELKDTYQGQVSMMQDAFRKLKLVIADAGVFELTAKAVEKLTAIFNDQQTKENMKKFGEGIVTVGKALGGIIDSTLALPKWMLEVGIIMAILGGKKGKLVAVGLVAMAQALDKITETYKNLTTVPNAFVELNEDLVEAEDKFKNVQDQLFATKDAMDKFYAKMRRGEDFSREEYKEFADLRDNLKLIEPRFDIAREKVEKLRNQIESLMTSMRNSATSTVGELSLSSMRPIKIKLEDEDIADAIEKVKKSYTDLNVATNALVIGTRVLTNHMDRNSISSVLMADGIAKITVEAEKAKEKTKEFADSMADNIEDSIMRMTKGLMSFKDVVKSVFRFVANEMVKQNIAKPLAGALSTIFAGTSMGQFTAGVGVPTFANGGRPTVGQPSIVGERGAELFVPDRAGTVIPNGQFGGQTINVTYAPQVNALDPRTAQLVIAENAPTIVGVVRQAFERNGQMVAL